MTELYVAESGKDSNPGTRQRPLRSLIGARDRVRVLRAKGRAVEHATVHVAGGTYPIDKAIRFGPQDSDVTYRGEKGAIVDGGVRISGWRETMVNGVRAWATELPAVREGRWDFRELFVNGARRPRARYPKFGYTGAASKNVFRIAEMRRPEDGSLPGFLEGDFRFKPAPGDIQDWPSLYDAEMVVLHLWTEDRLPQPSFNPKTGWVECARQSVFRLNETFYDTLARYYVDNLFEALTEPGEWYLNRHLGALYYIPMRGETPANTQVFAPRVRQFIQAEGVPYNREKQWGDVHGVAIVKNLRLEGLTFRHADWIQPEARMLFHDRTPLCERPQACTPQAAIQVPGTISFMAAENCAVADCRIEHVGFYGIEVGPGCRRIEVAGNHLTDLGGGGVKVDGGELDEAGWRRTGYCSIRDNTIQGGGRIFHAGVGILLGNTFENVVAHNRIHDLFYTGISIGWSWGYRETISRDNAILNNHIHTIGQGLLSDMGAIYTLGMQPGTVIAGNHVHDVLAHDYGSWGLYLDEGSSHMVVEQNLVHGTQGPCFTHHFGRENIIRHNVFISTIGGCASIGRADSGSSDNFDHNLFVSANGLIFHGGHSASPEAAFRSDTNWIVHARGKRLYCDNKPDSGRPNLTWDEWLAHGNDRHSKIRVLPAGTLPASPTQVLALLKQSAEAAEFGLAQPLWAQAGPRPKNRRKPMWQPLWRQ